MPPRAPSLPPAERRAALLEAALPLVLERGPEVTTREIAAAAGVAEGTIFRVFDSKDDLVTAAARTVFDTTVLEHELGHIRSDAPLVDRLTQLAEVTQVAGRRIVAVVTAFGRPCDRERLGTPHDLHDPQAIARVRARMAALLEPDAHRLRTPVAEVVDLIRMLAWMSVHPMNPGRPLTAPEIADVLLHGVLDAQPRPGAQPTPEPASPHPATPQSP